MDRIVYFTFVGNWVLLFKFKFSKVSFALLGTGLLLSSHEAPANIPAYNQKNNQKLLTARIALKEDQPVLARNLLESIPAGSREFIPALLELEKIHYRAQAWDRFFSYASFYRQKVLNDPSLWRQNFRQRFFALEILALLKHCLFSAAVQVGEQGLEIAKKTRAGSSEIRHALIFVTPFEKIKEMRSPVNETAIPSMVMSETHYWPIHPSTLEAIQHPKFLKFEVQSRCSR